MAIQTTQTVVCDVCGTTEEFKSGGRFHPTVVTPRDAVFWSRDSGWTELVLNRNPGGERTLLLCPAPTCGGVPLSVLADRIADALRKRAWLPDAADAVPVVPTADLGEL